MRYTYIIKRNGDLVTDLNISGTIENIKVIYKGECLWTFDDVQNIKHVSIPFWMNLVSTSSYHDIKIEVNGDNINIEWKYILIKDNDFRRYLCTLQNPIMYIEKQIEVF